MLGATFCLRLAAPLTSATRPHQHVVANQPYQNILQEFNILNGQPLCIKCMTMRFPLFLFLLFFTSFVLLGNAQINKIVQPGFWANLEGNMDGEYLHMSLFLDEPNNKIIGSFCMAKRNTVYPLVGRLISNDSILFRSIGETIPQLTFAGNFWEDANGFYFIQGTATKDTSNDIKPFKIKHMQSSFGSALRRYGEFKQTTEEVESFMQRTKEALLQGDSIFIANNLRYPITFIVNSKKLPISRPKEFLVHFKDIVTPKLKRALQKYHTHHLFGNHSGAMFGNGEIWISAYSPKTGGLGDIKITSIHLSDIPNEGPH